MIEVFKTDVQDRRLATKLVEEIHRKFTGYQATFDLDDCDKILRIKTGSADIDAWQLIKLLDRFGCQAEVLEDILPSITVGDTLA